MAVNTGSQVTTQDLKNTISICRKSARQFGNNVKDAKLEKKFSHTPCKTCAKSILDEINALNEECHRLQAHTQNNGSSTACTTCCSIDPKKNEDTDGNSSTMDVTGIKECMSATRKTIRGYNDHLDDGEFSREDKRPCETCKESISKECQGLMKELKRITELIKEDDMKDTYPCKYGCEQVSMRDGAGRRKHKNADSGFQSANSSILRREAIESQDLSTSPDVTKPEELDASKLDENEKGPCVSLFVSESFAGEDNSTDA